MSFSANGDNQALVAPPDEGFLNETRQELVNIEFWVGIVASDVLMLAIRHGSHLRPGFFENTELKKQALPRAILPI